MLDKVQTETLQLLDWRTHRQEVIAKNLANANTPGYKAMDVTPGQADFSTLLRTHSQHLQVTTRSQGSEFEREAGLQGSWDKSNVDVEQERKMFAENATHAEFLLALMGQWHQTNMLAVRGQ